MQNKKVVVGVVALVIFSFVLGIGFNKLQAYRRAERFSALLSAQHNSRGKVPSPVNMATALKQLQDGLSKSGLAYNDIHACDSRFFEIILTNNVKIQFQWRDMGEETSESLRALTSRLDRLRIVLNAAPASSSVKSIDMIGED